MADEHDQGLRSTQALAKLKEFGRNELQQAPAEPRWRLFVRQFASALVFLLLGACVVSVVLGEVADAVAILSILLVNAVIGYRQESQAEAAVQALRAMTAPRARVLRDGFPADIAAAEVVPGDLLLLEAGDIVAADATVLVADQLQAIEAALTGESEPVAKSALPCPPDAPLAERTDSVFAGTRVVRGKGRARVTATGMKTELGRIAGLLGQGPRIDTPLQHRLAAVGRTLMGICLAIVAVVALQALRQGRPWLEVVLTAVSLAVAAVPEGLPVMVTVALALGVQRMAARHVLVRKLPAVETLGCTTVICTDKTGTLTRGEMAVRTVWGDEDAVLLAAALCCDATLGDADHPPSGDPTELAILQAAQEHGLDLAGLERTWPVIAAHPFDTARKCMSLWRGGPQGQRLFVKGAAEVLLQRATAMPAGLQAEVETLSARGLRVLAVAQGTRDEEADLVLLGLIGLADPPRPEAVIAVKAARQAGIHVVMITGDHPRTAAAIAAEMGITDVDGGLGDRVHARATPEDKLRIVADWQRRGAVVAMTGDGVNDAPALERADIGIAMGKSGTEVTRQVADMVLADDNFSSIVAAVQEGRAIFAAIRRSLMYLLTGNFAELGVMLGAALAGWPVPLLPLQILWINLVTDGAPSLALVMEPADDDVLHDPPRPRQEAMLGARQWRSIIGTGVLETAVQLAAFYIGLQRYDAMGARTIVLTCVAGSQLWRSLGARSDARTLLQLGLGGNPRLWQVFGITWILQIALATVPALRGLFGLGPVAAADLMATVLWSAVPLLVVEGLKLLRQRHAAHYAAN